MAIPLLRARKQLADMEVVDYTHATSKSGQRDKIFQRVRDTAFPDYEPTPLTPAQVRKHFKVGILDG